VHVSGRFGPPLDLRPLMLRFRDEVGPAFVNEALREMKNAK
jgi:hypothetical protein